MTLGMILADRILWAVQKGGESGEHSKTTVSCQHKGRETSKRSQEKLGMCTCGLFPIDSLHTLTALFLHSLPIVFAQGIEST